MSEAPVLCPGELLPKWDDKCFDVRCRVSGSFGEMGPNPNPNIPRCVRQHIAEGQMSGQLQPEVPLVPDYQAKMAAAKAAIKDFLGKEVVVKHNNKSIA